MPFTTPDNIYYVDSNGSTSFWEHHQNQAQSVQNKFAAYETWNSWTLTFSAGPTTLGSGGVSEGFYSRIGNLVFAEFRVELGTGFAITGTTWQLNLPVTGYAGWGGAGSIVTLGSWSARDDNVPTHYSGSLATSGSGNSAVWFTGTTTNRISGTTTPFTWAAGDIVSGNLCYRSG